MSSTAAANATAMGLEGLRGSTLVCVMARNGVELGITPAMNTAIAHRTAGRMIGAGIARAPLACFTRALEALAEPS